LSEKFYVGLALTDCRNNGKRTGITSVTFQVDRDTVVSAGEYTGLDLYAVNPYATHEMAAALLAAVRGFRYQAFSAAGAGIDPSAELGDGVEASGLYSVISSVEDHGDGFPDLSAPGEEELEEEYPYRSTAQRELDSGVDSLRAFLTKALGEMQIELNSIKARMGTMENTLSDISNKVTELDSRVQALEGG